MAGRGWLRRRSRHHARQVRRAFGSLGYKILVRMSQYTARPEILEKLRTKLTEIEGLMTKWKEFKPQVTEEERSKVLKMIDKVRK
jgi:hypothetical protein